MENYMGTIEKWTTEEHEKNRKAIPGCYPWYLTGKIIPSVYIKPTMSHYASLAGVRERR